MRQDALSRQRQLTALNIPSTSSTTNSTERAQQLLDRESITTLLLLYLLDQEKLDITRLQKLLKLVCTHPGTCDFTIWALLSMFEGLDKFMALDCDDAPDRERYQSGWINELLLHNVDNRYERVLLVTPDSTYINNEIRTVSALRIIDNLSYFAESFALNFMPKRFRTPTGKKESPPPMPSHFWNIVRSINGRRFQESSKESAELMHEMVADSIDKSPLAQLFKLLDSNLAKESRLATDRIMRIIASLSHAIPSDFQRRVTDNSTSWLGKRLGEFTKTLMSSWTGRLLLTEMFRAIPSESHAILHAIYGAVETEGRQLKEQLFLLRCAAETRDQQRLLNVLMEVTGRDNFPGKLLKSLEMFQFLCNHLITLEEQGKTAELDKKDEKGAEAAQQQQATTSSNSQVTTQAKETYDATLVRNMVVELAPLWEELSNCLSLLEAVEDFQHPIIFLQKAAEAFFLLYSLVISPSAQLASVSLSGQTSATVDGDELGRCQREMFKFAEKHRLVLNLILRGNTQNLEGSAFRIITHSPKLLDFDVKTKYFHKELNKMDEQNSRYQRDQIAIRVRRSHLFDDSFQALKGLPSHQWKARLYIIFEGEEGQDAGGLLREWYTVITREIFNPNYALFVTALGDRATYMINKSSYVNPDHLDYFRFVGRVIANAIYDNKQLDCYFTRAFYKHILNKHVRYQDIESEDPDLFKSLKFLLNNPVEDLRADLNFSVEVEEFGVLSNRQLKENGLKTTVTDANKHEYVHLKCQMKMAGSIRQQLNAFLEGFYEVIPKRLISIFNEQELELLISGLPEIDIDDLCANTEYLTYTRMSPQVQWFWRALKDFDAEDKAKFLQFVTGTSKVPLQGFAHLEGMDGVQKFTIEKDTRSNDRLPSAHTCFNRLDLPEYPDYETLLKMLLFASRECPEGFAFA